MGVDAQWFNVFVQPLQAVVESPLDNEFAAIVDSNAMVCQSSEGQLPTNDRD